MIALDTNILIYACDKADPARQKVALDLISRISGGVLRWQVACEFIAASRSSNVRDSLAQTPGPRIFPVATSKAFRSRIRSHSSIAPTQNSSGGLGRVKTSLAALGAARS